MEKETGQKNGPDEDQSRKNDPDLRFGSGLVAVAGVISGLGIAVGVPAILLSLGQNLGQTVLTVLVVLALAGGALVCLVSAFFGLVIPRHLRGGPWMDPDKWRRFARDQRRWHHEGRHWHHGMRGGWGAHGDEDDADEEEDAPPAPKRKTRR
ncbi:MAG TPA: hypothetical protein VK786_04900 [bacterium]|nr:hypothetical protein [bacterium]